MRPVRPVLSEWEQSRRLCLWALAAALGLRAGFASAQSRVGTPRIGLLAAGAAPSRIGREPEQGVLLGLRERGYVEGQNIVLEWRYADGSPERLASLAKELVRLKVDVILALGPAPRLAASQATSSIPIIAVAGSDPVREGWAHSLARPGLNMTGLTVTYPELDAKRLEIFKQAFPEVTRIAVLLSPIEVPIAKELARDLEASARQFGMHTDVLEVRAPNDIAPALMATRQNKVQAVFVIATNLMVENRVHIANLLIQNRLMSVSEFPLMTQAGFLLSYGADLADLLRRSVTQMDKILKGVPVGDVPIERPTKFQLSVNLKTAKAIGLVVPQSLLQRADELIQ